MRALGRHASNGFPEELLSHLHSVERMRHPCRSPTMIIGGRSDSYRAVGNGEAGNRSLEERVMQMAPRAQVPAAWPIPQRNARMRMER